MDTIFYISLKYQKFYGVISLVYHTILGPVLLLLLPNEACAHKKPIIGKHDAAYVRILSSE